MLDHGKEQQRMIAAKKEFLNAEAALKKAFDQAKLDKETEPVVRARTEPRKVDQWYRHILEELKPYELDIANALYQIRDLIKKETEENKE